MLNSLRFADAGGLPDPEDATWWFLLNVVGLPAVVVSILATVVSLIAWHSAVRTVIRHGGVAVKRSSAAVRAGRSAALVWTVLVQTALVVMSYLLGQMFQLMFVPDAQGRYLADGKAYDLTDTVAAAFAYNHWTPISLNVVLGAFAFILLVDAACLFTKSLENVLAIVRWPALLLAVVAGGVGVLVLLLGLTRSGIYTTGMAGLYAIWVGLLVGWAALVRWSCTVPRTFVGNVVVPQR